MNQRNRAVIFRLTQQEYDALVRASAESGSRSLSDYSRSGLLSLAKSKPASAVADLRFAEVDRRLGELRELVCGITERVGGGLNQT